ncbi:protein unc-45 homolog A-like [Styela clava]
MNLPAERNRRENMTTAENEIYPFLTLLAVEKEGTTKGKSLAAQAIAKLIITQNPVIAFPGQRSLECVKALKELMHPECAGIQNFEAFMALTNLSAIDETHRRRIVHAKMTYDIETYMLEEHEMIRRAATETMCNMCMSPDFQEMMARGGGGGARSFKNFSFASC